ncbi:MAG: hypothetical protein HC902_02945 [Calothrix sp. SM1_5_4]|nr:hypothetical protein [Calothrix sp. SM1_5_4]
MFQQTRERLEESRWKEVLSGHVQGPPALVSEARKIALEVVGQGYAVTGKPSLESLTNQLSIAEESLEFRRAKISKLDRKFQELRWRYAQAAGARGLPLPYRVERISIYELLNQPLEELLNQLEADPARLQALKQANSKWEGLLAGLRRMNQAKDGGTY